MTTPSELENGSAVERRDTQATIDEKDFSPSPSNNITHLTSYEGRHLLQNGKAVSPVFTPSVGSGLGSPTALGIGAFATTLTTLSFSLMEWRGLTINNVFVADFLFVAGIGMLITAQWELVKGNSYGYTVLSAFGLFYAGFGAITIPGFGVKAAYGNDTIAYNNALGFFVIMWTVFNTFFFIGSLTINICYILIFGFVELAFLFIAAGYFALADGHTGASTALIKAGGYFAFFAGLSGWYAVAHLMCQEALFFGFPMGDTSRFFRRHKLNEQRPVPQHNLRDSGADEYPGGSL